MAEEMVELGFEGLDRFTDKYWDKTYDRLPAFPKSKKKRQQQQQQQKQYQQNAQDQAIPNGGQPPYPTQNSSRHPDKGYTSSRSVAPQGVNGYQSDPDMYAPDSGQDRYGRDIRYNETEEQGYRAPGPGFKVARGRDGPSDSRDMQVPYQQQAQPDYGQQGGYGGRPGPQRRGSSWSPPRSERQGRQQSRRRRSNSRSRSRSNDMKSRLIATVGGALVGGIAGNQAAKGKKYDTVATIAGAILGGVGAKEAAGQWDERKRKKEQQQRYGDSDDYDDKKRRNDRRRDDRYDRDDGYDRDDRYERDDRRRY